MRIFAVTQLQLQRRYFSNYATYTTSKVSPSRNSGGNGTSTSKSPRTSLTSDSNTAFMRISKLLSNHSVNLSISRRQAEQLVQCGQVTVAGEVIQISSSLIKLHEIRRQPSGYIKVKGKAIQFDFVNQKDGLSPMVSSSNVVPAAATTPRVWAVHKVTGEVVTENDPQGRPSLMDRLRRGGVGLDFKGGKSKQERQWHLKPIGRLDIPTEGLILVTNNGAFAREMELPESALHRVYRVRVHGRLTSHKLDRMRKGGVMYENVRYGAMKVVVERPGRDTSFGKARWIQVTCSQGKNRQIRNVFAVLGSKYCESFAGLLFVCCGA